MSEWIVDNDEETKMMYAMLTDSMSFVAAALRAAESERSDAIIHDPFARELASDFGIKAQLLSATEWSPTSLSSSHHADLLALRTRYLDEALEHRDQSIQQIVLLAAGLDARAFRLPTLKDCLVVEIDRSQDQFDHKRNVMQSANARKMAKSHHFIVTDLVEHDWEQKLVNETEFDKNKPTFWCLEGAVGYLDYVSIADLMKTIDGLSPSGSKFWVDMAGEIMVRTEFILGHTLRFGEDDPMNGVLGVAKWDLETQADLSKPGNHFGRQWKPITVGENQDPVPYSFIIGTKPSNDEKAPGQL